MATKKYSKDKLQVTYTTVLKFTEDSKAIKPYKSEADALIAKIKKATDDWAYDFAFTVNKKKGTAKIDRIKSIGYPQLRNGHQGEDGHDWQWQLDSETMGKGSKDRLYLDDISAKITKQSQSDKTVKVGSDQYTNVDVTVEVSGKFSAGTKH